MSSDFASSLKVVTKPRAVFWQIFILGSDALSFSLSEQVVCVDVVCVTACTKQIKDVVMCQQNCTFVAPPSTMAEHIVLKDGYIF